MSDELPALSIGVECSWDFEWSPAPWSPNGTSYSNFSPDSWPGGSGCRLAPGCRDEPTCLAGGGCMGWASARLAPYCITRMWWGTFDPLAEAARRYAAEFFTRPASPPVPSPPKPERTNE